jgi:hypothetical protein
MTCLGICSKHDCSPQGMVAHDRLLCVNHQQGLHHAIKPHWTATYCSSHSRAADHQALQHRAQVCLGPDKRAYTSVEKLVAVAKEQGVVAVHPGCALHLRWLRAVK